MKSLGWSELRNGELLDKAERQFDALITTDRNLSRQQNLAGRRLAILVLSSTSWPRLQSQIARIALAIASLRTGQYLDLTP